MTEKTYRITGMTCAACAAHVQKAVAKLPGVEHSEVNIATEKLNVRFDQSQLGFEQLKKAVEDAGYGLVDAQPLKKLELIVEGMTCAACSAAVERAVKKLPGVRSASVNLATNRASVEYDPSEVKLSEIKSAIDKAGYTSRDIEGENIRDVESEQRNRVLRIMRLRLIVAIIFAAPVLYIAMSHMFP
ncbi:MAG: copper ion binding protein, partial [Bacillota bacterium]